MRKNPKEFIDHIYECIELIELYLTEQTFYSFKNLPYDFKKRFPEIPWKKMAGTRDILIHEYFGVDLELTWKVLTYEIPKLKVQIQSIRQTM